MELELPRQRQPVEIRLHGHTLDIQHYAAMIKRKIEATTLDNVESPELGVLKIYPAAVND